MKPFAVAGIALSLAWLSSAQAVDLDKLYRTVPPSAQAILHARLLAQPALLTPAGELLAAEILTLDPAPIELQVMK